MADNVLLILAFASVFAYGSAIQCYVCKSVYNETCMDPFDKSAGLFVEECDASKMNLTGSTPPDNTTFFCRKNYQYIRGKVRITRSCGWEEYYIKERTCYLTATEETQTTVCKCTEPLCNEAASPQTGFLPLLASAVSGFVAHRLGL